MPFHVATCGCSWLASSNFARPIQKNACIKLHNYSTVPHSSLNSVSLPLYSPSLLLPTSSPSPLLLLHSTSPLPLPSLPYLLPLFSPTPPILSAPPPSEVVAEKNTLPKHSEQSKVPSGQNILFIYSIQLDLHNIN